jgi:hypothetical protein
MSIARAWIDVAVTSVRVSVATLLVTSGVMTIAASRERWSPACGTWDAPACLAVQDHRYDYLPPLAPWSPIGEAAGYASVAEMLLAAAVLVLPSLLFRGRPMLTGGVGAVISGCILVVALSTWASAQSGQAVTSPALVPAWIVWALAWPLALFVLAFVPRPAPARPGRSWRVLVLLALVAASPLPQALVSVGPYDAAPWMDASAGCLVILAGCALWPATARGWKPASSPAPLGPVQTLSRASV